MWIAFDPDSAKQNCLVLALRSKMLTSSKKRTLYETIVDDTSFNYMPQDLREALCRWNKVLFFFDPHTCSLRCLVLLDWLFRLALYSLTLTWACRNRKFPIFWSPKSEVLITDFPGSNSSAHTEHPDIYSCSKLYCYISTIPSVNDSDCYLI